MCFRRRKKCAEEKIAESQKAVEEAHQTLRRVRARDSEVHAISGALKSIRERNHFAEQLRTIMERG